MIGHWTRQLPVDELHWETGTKTNVNIFETMRTVTSRIEPLHTQFLADALADSLGGDGALFEGFWRLGAPKNWETPADALVEAEKDLEGHGRIDVCIRTESPARVLGVEVKTTDSSATRGQLARYRKGLESAHRDHDVAVAYLTPFNRQRAGEFADELPSVQEYERFAGEWPRSRHVSWLDVAEIDWVGDALWEQHKAFVAGWISSRERLRTRAGRDRSFNRFFGDAAADEFWERMSGLGVEWTLQAGARIPLSRIGDADAFASAFEVLINSEEGVHRTTARRKDRFTNGAAFCGSEFGGVHEALFRLSRFGWVWIRGEKDYGVRVAHHAHPGGVSLVRSVGADCLLVGQPR